MFVIIWATLLFLVRGSNDNKTSFIAGERIYCEEGICSTSHGGVITAEAGLCVVIPCSFTTSKLDFKTQNMIWFKCELQKPKCADSDKILQSNERRVQSGMRERVSLLEPDVSQNNCSIIVNDLTESDSGLYQFRVSGSLFGRHEGFKSPPVATVSVKGLTQKPTVLIPPLMDGQQITLSCTAPGLCSGSRPKITWTWRGKGKKDSYITGNITSFMTETLTPVAQRYSSSLMFTPSAFIHHGTKVTCKVGFVNNIMTEETVTLSVTLPPKILENSGCKAESEVLTCVCISQGFPLPNIKWPVLEDFPEYSVTTTVSPQSVNSTITLTVKDYSNSFVDCLSVSKVGREQRRLNIVTSERRDGEQTADQHGDSAAVPWAIAAVSLIVNVICVICMVFLWNTRKKAKPNQEDRTYMSLQKREISPDYEVIGPPLN